MKKMITFEEIFLEFINSKYPIHIEKIEKVTNEIFFCQGAHGNFYARVTDDKPYEAQIEEVKWMTYLLENGVNVAPVVSSLEGKMVETNSDDKCIVLYEEAPGRHLNASEWNPSILKILGKAIGKLHKVTKQYKQPIYHLKNWYQNEEYQFLTYIPEEESIIRDISRSVKEHIRAIPTNEENYGLLHGDIWLENVLVTNNNIPTLIDFQNCEKHYFLFDLAVPIYSALEFTFRGNGNITDYRYAITEAIIKGYEEEHSISADMLKTLSIFMKLKELLEYNQMHMYWPKEKRREVHIRILNLYRQRIEYQDIYFK